MAGKNSSGADASAGNNYNERKWLVPSKRAKGYAEERKLKVHKFGKKQGEELSLIHI